MERFPEIGRCYVSSFSARLVGGKVKCGRIGGEEGEEMIA